MSSFYSSSTSARMIALLFAMMAVLVEPHMIMATPKPYGSPDNSPLTGTNYPCKVTSDAATFYKTDGIIDQNSMGSAVHGGGSCQLALTSDMQPSASTSWRVILSIESGCPSTDGSGPGTYNYTIPADLTPGQYSFAWTWISKLAGQPEYYMNCAPITVTAAKAKRDNEGVSLLPRADSYPELFVANLDSVNSCKTSPGTDVVYPDPGDNVEKLLEGATPSFATISAAGCVPKSQTQGAGSLPTATAGDTAGGAAAGTTPAASASASATASSDAGASSSSSSSVSGGGIFATTGGAAGGAGAGSNAPPQASSVYVSPVTLPSPSTTASASASDSASATSSESSATTASETTGSASAPASSSTAAEETYTTASSSATATGGAATPSATLSPTGSGSGSSNSTGGGGGSSSASGKSGACTDEGMFNCVGSKYQQCASGAWTAMQALPGGTTCTQGESENLWARSDGGGARTNGGVRKMRWGGRMPVYSA
ncbi:hypothetical protein Daus18300_006181 [Diaporthe australafricana]|uniref:Lytic polysaccharide monooxygenase n=1 Tax=Diaporthe australafricana TaxID=127596 RepID=A0ABR3WW48_9PEZI